MDNSVMGQDLQHESQLLKSFYVENYLLSTCLHTFLFLSTVVCSTFQKDMQAGIIGGSKLTRRRSLGRLTHVFLSNFNTLLCGNHDTIELTTMIKNKKRSMEDKQSKKSQQITIDKESVNFYF